MEMIRYVTYGITKDKFSKEKFYEETYKSLPCKPLYGLWGSRVDAEYGWKDWCADSGFRECSDVNKMEFVLAKDSKILEVHREVDILPYIVFRLHSSIIALSKDSKTEAQVSWTQ